MDTSKISDYLRTLDRSERTIETYAGALKRFVDIVGEDAPMDHETYGQFLAAIKSLSPSTKRGYNAAVRGLYAFCEAGDPVRLDALKRHHIKRATAPTINFEPDEIEDCINTLTNPRYLANRVKAANKARKDITRLMILRDRAFVLTLADTGLRMFEACGLKRGDVDMRRMRAAIVGKGDKPATVYFSPRSIAAIREYLQARSDLDGKTGKLLQSLPLFASHDIRAKHALRPVGTAGMRKAIKQYARHLRMHNFRHYFVTDVLIESDGDLKLAQELARHKSITMTQRYAHLTETHVEAGYRKIFDKKK